VEYSGVRDLRAAQVEVSESAQPFELYKPRIGDFGRSQMNDLEIAKLAKMRQTCVGDLCGSEVQIREIDKPS
jgi:hypothetical protein